MKIIKLDPINEIKFIGIVLLFSCLVYFQRYKSTRPTSQAKLPTGINELIILDFICQEFWKCNCPLASLNCLLPIFNLSSSLHEDLVQWRLDKEGDRYIPRSIPPL